MKTIKNALMIFTVLSILICGIYPAIITALSQTFFTYKANGQIVEYEGHPVGAELIAQEFTENKFFWARPSAAKFNANASSGSNYSLINKDYQKVMSERIASGAKFDLLSTSGSGLDPHISPKAAAVQVDRIALARGLNKDEILKMIALHTEPRQLGFLGEVRVNVLKLNLDLENNIHE